MPRLDKVALVTGSSKGIGRAIAIKLAKDGFDLVINYRSNGDVAREVGLLCESFGVKVLVVKADVTRPDEVEAMMSQVIEEFGKLDVLVNNAGITKDSLVLRMSLEDFTQVVDANLNSAFNCSKEAVKYMMKKRSGSIVNITSIVGLRGNAGQVNYSASKAGLIGMTKSLAKEFASRSIRVNAVAPGFIETDMTGKLKDDVIEELKKSIPLKRLGNVEDIANMVSFLAKDDSSYITGQVISVDGGMNI